jgi:hypothetical protein
VNGAISSEYSASGEEVQVWDLVSASEELCFSSGSVLNGGAQSAASLIGPSTGNAFMEFFSPGTSHHFIAGNLCFGTGGAIFGDSSSATLTLNASTHIFDCGFLAVGHRLVVRGPDVRVENFTITQGFEFGWDDNGNWTVFGSVTIGCSYGDEYVEIGGYLVLYDLSDSPVSDHWVLLRDAPVRLLEGTQIHGVRLYLRSGKYVEVQGGVSIDRLWVESKYVLIQGSFQIGQLFRASFDTLAPVLDVSPVIVDLLLILPGQWVFRSHQELSASVPSSRQMVFLSRVLCVGEWMLVCGEGCKRHCPT